MGVKATKIHRVNKFKQDVETIFKTILIKEQQLKLKQKRMKGS